MDQMRIQRGTTALKNTVYLEEALKKQGGKFVPQPS